MEYHSDRTGLPVSGERRGTFGEGQVITVGRRESVESVRKEKGVFGETELRAVKGV